MKQPDHHHQLVKDFRGGDATAARKLYDLYSKAMYNTLIRITGNNEDAADLLQEAFIKAFRKIDTFGFESTFGAWLKKIVINTGLEFLRKKKVRFEELEPMMEIRSEETETIEIQPEKIHAAIKTLPSGSRTVVSLYLIEGFKHEEIANELGISVSTSKTQYMRGKKMLQEKLKGIFYEN